MTECCGVLIFLREGYPNVFHDACLELSAYLPDIVRDSLSLFWNKFCDLKSCEIEYNFVVAQEFMDFANARCKNLPILFNVSCVLINDLSQFAFRIAARKYD